MNVKRLAAARIRFADAAFAGAQPAQLKPATFAHRSLWRPQLNATTLAEPTGRDNMTDRLRRLRDHVRELEDAEQPTCALLAAREILRNHPDDANALLVQGRLLASLARYGEAEASLAAALDHFSDDTAYVVYRELGHLYRSWGRLELSLAQFEKVVALRPEHASGHIYAGAVLAILGRFDEAAASHTRATQCSEGLVDEAYYNLGLIRRAQERFGEARACFERALELDPNYPEARQALSDVATALQM